MNGYFGTDGIRGVYGETITEELCFAAGRAIGAEYGSAVIGRDTRRGGASLCGALADGIASVGAEAADAGILPTPAIAYLAAKRNFAGVVVSASHNPPEYNGIKLFDRRGIKPDCAAERRISYLIDNPPPSSHGGKKSRLDSSREEYVEYVANGADAEGAEVLLDCAFGAAGAVAKEVFEAAGARPKLINSEPDGSRINLGCGALYPEAILAYSPRLGFSFDGDADRVCAAVDGETLDGDSTLYSLSQVVPAANGAVVGTIMSNPALEEALAKRNVRFCRTDVGDKYVAEKMLENGFTLGGEQSGHYIIAPATTGDGLRAALRLTEAAARGKITRLKLMPQITASFYARREILTDSRFLALTRFYRPCLHRLIVRMSGTEPKIRITAESRNRGDAETAIKAFARFFEE